MQAHKLLASGFGSWVGEGLLCGVYQRAGYISGGLERTD